MSARNRLSPSIKKQTIASGSWDVESIFSPPKHHFDGNEPPMKKSPPRFMGKRNRNGAHSYDIALKNASREDSPSMTKLAEGNNDAKAKSEEDAAREDDNNSTITVDQEFPIKFSLSNDYSKADESFTEYLKDGFMGPSPRGSPGLESLGAPTMGSSFGAMFEQSPQRTGDTFDFDSSSHGFASPKSSHLSPLSTPPRVSSIHRGGGGSGGNAEDGRASLANAKLESPPSIKKPAHYNTKSNLSTPRFPVELIRGPPLRDLNKNGAVAGVSPYSRRRNVDPGSPYSRRRNVEQGSPYNYGRPISMRGANHHRHHRVDGSRGGPAQHLSPGQTIYNVASKSVGTSSVADTSVGSPPSPYQPYPWHRSSSGSAYHHNSSHSTPQPSTSMMGPSRHNCHGRSTEATPEFNPPRGNLRGQSMSGSRETTITITARGGESDINRCDNGKIVEDNNSKLGESNNNNTNSPQLDPITPSPSGGHIRQAISDESSSPRLAPTVHHPPPRPACQNGGGWSDSLHMAPLPPYVQAPPGQHGPPPQHHHPQGGGWGGGHPPAMPLPSNGGSGYPHGGNPYYSPYYHQHQQPPPHQCPQQHRQHRHQVPDHAMSSNGNPEASTDQNPREAADWRKNHHLLHQFCLQFGHCNVPQGYGVGTHYESLHQWCNEQRAQYQRMMRHSNGNDEDDQGAPCFMTPTRVRMLTSMGFIWGQGSNFHPNAGSSRRDDDNGSNASNTNKASKPYSTWDKWMELLSDYKSQHGNVDVPLKYEPNPSLGTFVNRQRTEYRKLQSSKPSSMTPERVEELNRLGFTWAVRDSHTSWEDRFAELQAFRHENGHCNVPKIYNKNPSLGYWVNEQRFQYRRLLKKKPSYMTQEKIKALNGLEFKWSLRETNGSWENWLKELREYRAEHGDVDVPLKYRHNQALGAFVNRQRTEYRKLQQGLQTSLTEERIRNLNELGFKWAIRVSRTPWETRLEELKHFKEQHGHCNVPSTYPKNQPLAYWVFKQRGQFRIFQKRDYVVPGEKKQMCHMTPDRISKLDAIGFEWNPPRRIK